jgi:hypothetical protein
VLQAGVKVGEALDEHGKVLLHLVQRQQTVGGYSTVLEISLKLFANGDPQFPFQSGESVQSRLRECR